MSAYIREHFTRHAFRLETLQQYEVASDGSDFARHLAGEPGPTPERKQPWLDRLREESDRGLVRSRVRLVTHPVTDYTRYECEWGYAPNVDAGENIAILDAAGVQAAEIAALCRMGDFWLLDDTRAVIMRYGQAGQFLGAECTADPAPFREIAEHAKVRAEPFTEWWANHREYHRNPARRSNDVTAIHRN